MQPRAWLKARPGDLAVFTPWVQIPFAYYYRGQARRWNARRTCGTVQRAS